jgi:hypothetical protein
LGANEADVEYARALRVIPLTVTLNTLPDIVPVPVLVVSHVESNALALVAIRAATTAKPIIIRVRMLLFP